MEIEGISISLGEVSSTASSISARNARLTQMLEDIGNKVMALESTWQSEGGEKIRSAMAKMKPTFQNYKSYMDEYVKFLNDTVAAYEGTENQVKTNASSFE